jgi:glycerophosphoryl diester phosphodiesterase
MSVYRPLVLAHRGFSDAAPENTMAAFEAARRAGADGIEFDVQRTRDGELVVIHDQTVDRTTNGTGQVQDFTYKQLQGLDAGSWFHPSFHGERIPLLQDVLEWGYTQRMLLNVELKTGSVPDPDLIKKTVQLIQDHNVSEQVLISSFDPASLHMVKALNPKLRIGLLYEKRLAKPWEYALWMGAFAIHPRYTHITSDLVEACHSRHIRINTWTVNTLKGMRRMVNLGVDAIITNYPDRMRELLKRG